MVEQRCGHGFLRSVVPCPECDDVRGLVRSQTHSRSVTNEEIAEAIKRTGGIKPAADLLYIDHNTIRNRAKQSELVRRAIEASQQPRAESHGLVGTYTCTCCHKDKPKSEFYISRSDSRGHQSRCKACDNNKRTQRLRRMRGAYAG